MERRTTLGIAGGLTLAAAAAAAVIGVNLGLMSDTSASTGPGTFEPAAVVSNTTAPPTTEQVVTIYVDQNGNPIDPSAVSTTTAAPAPSGVTTSPTVSPSPAPYVDDDRDDHSGDDHDSDDDHGGEREEGHDDDD
jgi:hypothetical protein